MGEGILLFTREIADECFKAKVYLGFNAGVNTENQYGWMKLPTEINVNSPVKIEERVGLYGGGYSGSAGAPTSHGLCTMGSFSYSTSKLPAKLEVGRYCSISSGLCFLDSHHQSHLLTTSALTFRPHNLLFKDLLEELGNPIDSTWDVYGHKAFPKIANDVWIGRDVTLSMGINIGNGSIIAAGSVVTKDVPPYMIVGGNPAQVIRTRFPNEIVERLLLSRWWDKSPKFIAGIASLPVEESLQIYEKNKDNIELYQPLTLNFLVSGLQITKPVIS